MALLITLATFLASCGLGERSTQTRGCTPPIQQMTDIAGTWEGNMTRSPRSRQTEWITLRIVDDGAYEFGSYRTIGGFQGQGRLVLEHGR